MLTTPSQNAVVEHWRHVARAAALAEHDTNGHQASRLSAAQAQALVGDVAAITQAQVVLDKRYINTPGWEKLSQPGRLGWAALATALDVSLGQPDYSIDQTGWRPHTKILKGPAKPGILGVLQAEHNLLVRLKTFPNAMNLRLIIDSQRQVCDQLVPFAARIDGRVAERWTARVQTYTLIQQQLRNIAGRLGTGGLAVTEASNATTRLRAVPPGTIIEPRVLAGLQTLFDRLDTRIADIIEDGVKRGAFLQRVTLPRIATGGGQLVHPVRERFVPVNRATELPLVTTVRAALRPKPVEPERSNPGRSRVDLHAGLVHRPSRPRPPQL